MQRVAPGSDDSSGRTETKTRVAIIGGGPSALATAFELTATPELEARHDVTIYQPGWRLGGKCASGRNRELGDRIEEHGLHVWFGCYDNAFSIIRRCYAELGTAHPGRAMPTWRDAFKPCHQVVVWDRDLDWDPHALDFPPTPGLPGVERRREFTDVLREVLAWIDTRLHELRASDRAVAKAAADHPLGADQLLQAATADVGVDVARVEYLGSTHLLECAARFAERHLEHLGEDLAGPLGRDVDRYAELLHVFREWVRDRLPAALPAHPEFRFFASTVDIAVAACVGILRDRLLSRGFDAINDEELSQWLARHGADIDEQQPERNSAFLRGVYDGAFAFVDGDPLRPNMAAGRALQGAIRCLFHYNGAVLWRMQAGMGDVVIAPLYEVLEARGVKFAFFHAVEEVRPSADGRRVGEIELVPQVATAGARDYRPLIEVDYDDRPLPCWPDRPLYDQLAGGSTTEVRGADFEHEINPLGVQERATLVADRDFDVAVLAVPPPVQERICTRLRAVHQGYDAMLGQTNTVVTQAAQLWLDRSPEELGWQWNCDSLMTMYVEPLDTYCDMSHLLPCEHWPDQDRVRHIAYFCGVISEAAAADAALAKASVEGHTQTFLEQDAARFWPGAGGANGRGFEWDRLVAPADLTGPARLSAQYLRVNWQPSERYVLTLAGTVSARPWPSERCFDNLVFAGDWTRNGFDAGCVEGAITSGMLASEAICGSPPRQRIAGLDGPSGFPNGPRRAAADGGGGLLGQVGQGVEEVAGILQRATVDVLRTAARCARGAGR